MVAIKKIEVSHNLGFWSAFEVFPEMVHDRVLLGLSQWRHFWSNKYVIATEDIKHMNTIVYRIVLCLFWVLVEANLPPNLVKNYRNDVILKLELMPPIQLEYEARWRWFSRKCGVFVGWEKKVNLSLQNC